MIVELKEHHIAEIREKIDNWPASKLNAKDLRDDIRKLLDHIEWLEGEARRIDEEWREFNSREI
jgi:hypothetical protein